MARQALPMVWDYVETNPLAGAGGDIQGTVWSVWEVLNRIEGGKSGIVKQADAQQQEIGQEKIVSTDPPYYDNIGYADLSGFFYVWLRRSLRFVFPDLFATLAVPRDEELVATPYRHGGSEQAEVFFLEGMTLAIHRLAEQTHPVFPVTIYYAFKQTETKGGEGTASTGWETFLGAVIKSGFAITGTWPIRSELATRNIGRRRQRSCFQYRPGLPSATLRCTHGNATAIGQLTQGRAARCARSPATRQHRAS